MVDDFIKELEGQKVCANCKFYQSYYVFGGIRYVRMLLGMCSNKNNPDPDNIANSRFVMTGCEYFVPKEDD